MRMWSASISQFTLVLGPCILSYDHCCTRSSSTTPAPTASTIFPSSSWSLPSVRNSTLSTKSTNLPQFPQPLVQKIPNRSIFLIAETLIQDQTPHFLLIQQITIITKTRFRFSNLPYNRPKVTRTSVTFYSNYSTFSAILLTTWTILCAPILLVTQSKSRSFM